MLLFFVMLVNFVRAIGRTLKSDPQFRSLTILVVLLLLTGGIFYHIVEGWSFLNSFYFCLITLATVGYGDYTPHTALGKLFTMVYILLGISILLGFVESVAVHEPQRMLRRRHEKPPLEGAAISPENRDIADGRE